MFLNRTLALVTLTLSVELCACASPRLLSMPLTFRPTNDVGDLRVVQGEVANGWGGSAQVTGPDMTGQVIDAFSGQTLQVLPLVDARTNKETIGQNVEGSTPRPVTTPDNVADFVTFSVGEVLKACRVPVTQAAPSRQLKGELDEYFVQEGNRYEGRVLIHFVLADGQGHELWQGTVHGQESKWGRSFSAENYDEDLSDATARAVHELLLNPQFLMAVHTGH